MAKQGLLLFFSVFLPNRWTTFGHVNMLASLEGSDMSFLYHSCQFSASMEDRVSCSTKKLCIFQVN